MCGIFGWITVNKKEKHGEIWCLKKMIILSSRRGKDACGIWYSDGVKEKLLKLPVNGKKFVGTSKYLLLKKEANNSRILVGQTRLATNGDYRKDNNQPISKNETVLVHNGIIVNIVDLAKKYGLNLRGQSDSVVIVKIFNKLILEEKGQIENALKRLSREMLGTFNLAIYRKGKLVLATNNGSLYLGRTMTRVYFASEHIFLKKLAKKYGLELTIEKINPREMVILEDGLNKERWFKLPNCWQNKFLVEDEKEEEGWIRSHKIDFRAINKIKRCRKCILPETTPNISFNNKGICNYCSNYKKIEINDGKKLREMIKGYRSNDGSPDCVLAFSGGRDSSFGLHYLVKVLGMHPIAVTFDWGMLSDIGRKNQALMLGKLEIEQIVVAADMVKVRADIKKNLEAWLVKPDLGMVPILMQGDKTTEYHIDKIKRELGLKLVIFCRGNELEREEFKAGYCGVKNADPGGVIHNYSLGDKLRLLQYYLKQFLINQKYINSSLWSSMLGYLVTYVIPHNYVYLWHYVKWNEKEILNVLRKEYAWLGDNETGLTWRVDDGSPAFYNYLYCQIQGFTENDSFRSNQIREGLLTRKQALNIVGRENKPRYRAIQWYFDTIKINGEKVLSTIDRVKRRYKSGKM